MTALARALRHAGAAADVGAALEAVPSRRCPARIPVAAAPLIPNSGRKGILAPRRPPPR